DLDIMKQVAPMAVERTHNNRYLFSNRVNPKSLIYQGIYQDWSIPALALKSHVVPGTWGAGPYGCPAALIHTRSTLSGEEVPALSPARATCGCGDPSLP